MFGQRWVFVVAAVVVVALAVLPSSTSARTVIPLPQPQDEPGKGYFLNEAIHRYGAMCLDGSAPLYYYRAGTGTGARKWYIHHMGGGWCSSFADCYARSQGGLGSTKSYPAEMKLGGGYFSQDPKENPQMYNWNSVFMIYCDGGSFSGNNMTKTTYQGHDLYFRGFKILTAMRDDLLANRGLKTATDVVISGCSAGGLATYLHLDWWSNSLSFAKVVGLPDSGFFLDYESPIKKYHSSMIWTFETMAAAAGVNQQCIAAHTASKDTWKCFFAQHTAPFIQTPIFPLQSQYDSWQLSEDLDSENVTLIDEYGKNLTDLVKTQLIAPHSNQNGIFLDSCKHHCGEWGSIVIDGKNQAAAFQQWYDRLGQKVYIQPSSYPCAQCCKL